MRNRFPVLNLGFLYLPSDFLLRMDKKSEFLIFFGMKSSQQFFSNSGLWQTETVCEGTLSIIFHVMLWFIFQGSYCTFSKCNLGLTQCSVSLYSFSFANFSKLSCKYCSLVDPNLFGSILCCNHGQKCTKRFFGIFCFQSFWVYGCTKHLLTNKWIIRTVNIIFA